MKKWISLIVVLCLLSSCAFAQTAEETLRLGDRYLRGDGVEKDDAKAFSYYLQAAETGLTEALCRVGQMYFYGCGTELDYEKSLEWYLKAAEAGDAAAMSYVGRDYAFRDRTEEKFADKYIGHTTHGYGDENGYSDINGGWRNAEELSCDVGGEIYTVKGFSPEFALCIKSDVNGKYYAFCNFDLEIGTGSDLLGENAYNLKSNIVSAKYQPHSEWDIGLVNYRQLDGVDKADLEKLIDSICRSDVIDSDESYEKIITDDVIKTQRHIILNMGESWPFRTITFRMYEGGYVWIESLCAPGVLFKVDDTVFGKIYDAAKDIPVTDEQIRAHGLSPDDFD